MKKAARKTSRKVLQQALEEVIETFPRNFAAELFKKKLTAAGFKPTRKLVTKLVDHTLAGGSHEFEWQGGEGVELTITAEDIADFSRAGHAFFDALPEIVGEITTESSNAILKAIKAHWPEHQRQELEQKKGFHSRLEARWGEALNLLRMMLSISLEIGEANSERNSESRASPDQHKRHVLSQLHIRSCQVTSEILRLLESGYADGAMARWRTLYEIGVVAKLIADHDDSLAERYLAHEIIEARNALKIYIATHEELGYAPVSQAEIDEVHSLCEAAIVQFGPEFARNYGWAAKHLRIKDPRFIDLEKEAVQAKMRSHYKMASYNVHADVKGITFKHGSLLNPRQVIAGSSNAGLEEPGQNTSITLSQIAMLLLMIDRPQLDDLVTMRILATLQRETVEAFVKAGDQLKRDERERWRGSDKA